MNTGQTKLDRFSRWAIDRRVFIIWAVVILVGIFSLGMPKIHTDVILWHMFPYDHPFLKLNARFAEVFGGGGSGAVVAIKTKTGDIFNADTGVWVCSYIFEEDDLFTDGNYVFRLQSAENWYDNQIASANIPWRRFAKAI